jgi:hypothetical protein
MVIMENKDEKKIVDRINDIDWSKFMTWTTVISLTMIAYYGIGALKHWKEYSKLK